MQSSYHKKTLLAASIAAAFYSVPGTVHAASVLEEVVVTARKRVESLQETPVAVTAMSGEQMTETGIRSSADLRMAVPNVDVYSGNGTSGVGSFFIRGVGARNTGLNFDSGVGIYLDGLYLSRAEGAILDNVDIASMEVLRGPQGTLFGKNTTGGAVLYSTNKPTDIFEGAADVRLGNYDRMDGKFTVNIPLIEDLLNSRFSVFSTRRDGYVENVTLNQMMNDEDRQGAQAHFLLLPSDDVEIDFNNFYAKTDQRPRGQKCIFIGDIPGAGWQALAMDGQIIAPSTGKTIAEHCRDNEALDIDKVTTDIAPSRYMSESYSSAVTVSWDINDQLSFKSVTGFRGTRSKQSQDLDASAIPLLQSTQYFPGNDAQESEQWTQEFQLSGTAFDERMNFVGGVYAFSEKSDGGGVGVMGPFFGVANVAPLAFYTASRTELETDNSSYSVFTQVDWSFNEQWSMTAGIRYTTESRELSRRQDEADTSTLTNDGSAVLPLASGVYFFPNGAGSFNPNHGLVHVATPFGAIPDIDDQETDVDDSAWTPMVSVQRTLDGNGFIDTGSIYATISKGFLSGGIADSLDPFTQQLPSYDPEKVTNYEIGFKFDAFDRRVRVNTALFYMDYRDRQLISLVVTDDGRVASVPINAAESSITGLEIESQFIPIDDLQITLNLTFNDGDIKEFDDHRVVVAGSLPDSTCRSITAGGTNVDFCDVDRSDENLPRLPKAIYFLAGQYTFHTAVGDITPRIQWSLRTDVENCFDRSSCVSGAYFDNQRDLGARVTWTSVDQRWSMAAYGTNLLDQRYNVGGVPLVDVTQTGGVVNNDPRMYGVEMHYAW